MKDPTIYDRMKSTGYEKIEGGNFTKKEEKKMSKMNAEELFAYLKARRQKPKSEFTNKQ